MTSAADHDGPQGPLGADVAVQVMTTIDSRETAEALARGLVEARLAACVQRVGPITSTYRWQDEVEVAEEHLLIVKTTRDRYAALEAYVRERHDYDVPELTATEITAGSRAYLDWITAETHAGQPGSG